MTALFTKLGLLFTNLENIKAALAQAYVIINKLPGALKLVNDLVPDETKVQKGLDKIFPVLDRTAVKISGLLEIVARVFKIELPTITASSADPIGDLEAAQK